jgi:biopolymer transport protein ExbB
MGILAKVVVIILFIMSGWSIGVMIDRWMAFSAARNQSRAFAPAVAGALRDGKIDEAIKVAERNKKSHLAKVVTAGLMEFKAHQDSPGEIPGRDHRSFQARSGAHRSHRPRRTEARLGRLGDHRFDRSLRGTVRHGGRHSERLQRHRQGKGNRSGSSRRRYFGSAGDHRVGLFVAIPAVMMFNYLTGRVEAFDVEMDNSSSELIDYFLKRRSMRRS